MAILESIIVASCVGMSGQAQDACNKALQAGSKQSGMEQSFDSYEQHQTKMLEQTAYDWFGKDAVGVVGGTVWVGKAVAEKKASVGLPSFGICNKMSAEVGQKASQLVLKWSF